MILSALSNLECLVMIKISIRTRQYVYIGAYEKKSNKVASGNVNLLSKQGICAFGFSFLATEWKVLKIGTHYNGI